MLASVLTLRFDPVLEAFDDGPLQEFLRAKEVHAIREHFFVRDGVPYLAVLVTYGLPPAAALAEHPARAQGREPSWRSQVSEEDLPLFNALRDWRSERAGFLAKGRGGCCGDSSIGTFLGATEARRRFLCQHRSGPLKGRSEIGVVADSADASIARHGLGSRTISRAFV